MAYVPTEQDLKRQVKLVEIVVEGEYIARIDEKRKTSRTYKVPLLVPEGFNKSDIKRLVPRELMQKKDDFVALRTFNQMPGAAKKTDKKMLLGDMFSDREKTRFKKIHAEIAKTARDDAKERSQMGDTSRYGSDGLPPVINDD